MDVAILGAGQGWHFAELERALRARGHRAHDLRVSALVARIGDRPRLDAGGVALQDVDAVLTRTFPKGSLEQVIFRVDALHWLERLGIPVMNPATAIERTVDKFYTSALLDAAGLPTPRTVVAERMDDAMTAFRALARRDRQAPVRLGRARHGPGQRRGDRASRLPRPGSGARRLLPAGGRAPRRPRPPGLRRRRPRRGGRLAVRRGVAHERGPGSSCRASALFLPNGTT